MTHDEIIAVVQAHKEGNALQFKRNGLYIDYSSSATINNVLNYISVGRSVRIKPEARVMYVSEYDCLDRLSNVNYTELEIKERKTIPGETYIKFVEEL